MENSLSWVATAATILAASITASNLSTRITGYGFIVFTVGSIAWFSFGLMSGQPALMWTNAALTVLNLFGIWRWLGRQATIEDGSAAAARASQATPGEALFPVSLLGHAKVREMSPTPIQAGENWWFPRGFAEAIEAGASDFIMPDLMKCGGVTGWLQVAAQASAANIPMSSHLFAEASAHMLAVTPTAHWLEFLDFAGAILAHPAKIVDGTVTARGLGLGLEWNETAVVKYLIE